MKTNSRRGKCSAWGGSVVWKQVLTHATEQSRTEQSTVEWHSRRRCHPSQSRTGPPVARCQTAPRGCTPCLPVIHSTQQAENKQQASVRMSKQVRPQRIRAGRYTTQHYTTLHSVGTIIVFFLLLVLIATTKPFLALLVPPVRSACAQTQRAKSYKVTNSSHITALHQ